MIDERVNRLQEITENEDDFGSTEVTLTVMVLTTSVDDVAGNLNVNHYLS